MSQLIVITYPTVDEAERVVETLGRLEDEHLLDLADLVYVSRAEDGVVTMRDACAHSIAHAARAVFWGTVLGRLFGSAWLGAGLGAASGAITALTHDCGISNRFVRTLTRTLAPGTSAVFGLVRRATRDRVLPELGRFGGTVLHTSLSLREEEALQTALDREFTQASALLATRAAIHPPRGRRVSRTSVSAALPCSPPAP